MRLLVLLAVAVAGCAEAGSALGRTPNEARAHADELFFALGARFGPVAPAEGYPETRSRFSRSALVPSRLFADSSVWTSFDGQVRELRLTGEPRPAGYLLGGRDRSALTGRTGEYQRFVGLERLSDDEFEWTVRDELIVGEVSPDQLGAALAAIFRAVDHVGSNEAAIRHDYRSALPRTTAALGKLFALDSIALVPDPRSGTRVTLQVTIHPDRITNEFPDYSKFLQRYVSRSRFHVLVEDPAGVPWWTASLARDQLILELRIHRGRLAPLEGPPRPMPDRLRARVDAATRVRIFGVGFNGLVGEVSIRRARRDKSVRIIFPREPDWQFPLLVERFIRAPLRRPFAGDGATLAFSARQTAGSTRLVRDYRIAVQESAIVRWIGGLGTTAIDDFRQRAEAQYEQYVAQVFHALREDASTLLR